MIMAPNHRLVRVLVILNVVAINLFFKIRNAKVNRIVRKIPKRIPPLTTRDRCTPLGATIQNTSKSTGPDRDDVVDESGGYEIRGIMSYVMGNHQLAPGYELVAPLEEGQEEGGGASNLPKVDKYVYYYYLASLCAHWYLLVKSIILCLLRHDTFAHYRYLDCLILGRQIVNGRVIEVAPYCTCFQAAIRLIWYYTMMWQRTELRIPCVEFLLNKPAHEQYWARGESPPPCADQIYHSTLLEFQSPNATRAGGGEINTSYKLRPNRTRDAWAVLGKCTLLYHSLLGAVLMLIASLFLAMGLPVTLTWPGFAYNYRHCLQWLASGNQQWRGLYSAFGMPTDRAHALKDTNYARPKIIRDFFMPYTQLVDLNRLHLLRIALEVLESIVIYLELAASLSSGLYLSVMMSKDVTNYCQSINAHLERSIAMLRMRARSVSKIDDGEMGQSARVASPIKRRAQIVERPVVLVKEEREQTATLMMDIAGIQAMVADLFQTIDSYNKFISLHSIFLLIYWLTYSALISSWIFLPGNESPKLEWYVIHCFATLYVFLMLSYMSDVRASCRQLYGRLTVAMALDEDYTTRKKIWLSLLTFYKPKPLYCFTLIGSIELTHMSGIQLLVWLFSALVVASSFFHVYNIK